MKLAVALHTTLAESKTRLARRPHPQPRRHPRLISTPPLDQTLGAKATNNGGVYQFSIPRAQPIKDDGTRSAADGLGQSDQFSAD